MSKATKQPIDWSKEQSDGQNVNPLTGEKINNHNLTCLANLANIYKALEQDIKKAESYLKNLKEELRDVSEKKIPSLMEDIGMKKFTLTDGSTIELQDFFSVKMSDKPTCHRVLEDLGHGGLVKREISIPLGKESEELCEKMQKFCQDNNITMTPKEQVHWATLNSLARELSEQGETLPEKFFDTYQGTKTKLK